MNHRAFHKACASFNWGWRYLALPEDKGRCAQREHELTSIAAESEPLRRIMAKAEAAFWERRQQQVQREVPF